MMFFQNLFLWFGLFAYEVVFEDWFIACSLIKVSPFHGVSPWNELKKFNDFL